MSTDLPLVPGPAAAAAAGHDAAVLMQGAQAGDAPDPAVAAQLSRPRPAGLQRRLASGTLAQTPPRPRDSAPQPVPAAPGIETLLAELFQNNHAAITAAAEQKQSGPDQAYTAPPAPSTDHAAPPDAAQVRTCEPEVWHGIRLEDSESWLM